MVEQATWTYEEAYEASLEYFNGDEVAAKTFVDKYPLKDNDSKIIERTPDAMHDRLAHEFARIDADKYSLNYDERFRVYRDAMDHFARIVPQGSPMAAIGNPYRAMSASNCVVVSSPEDSVEGILKTCLDLAQLYKRRAGVGFDISSLRPDGMAVNNAARTTSGAWSFADLFSSVTNQIGQRGRRGASMITIDVHHPDVEPFALMKRDRSKVTGANVSVRLSNDFMRAVENDTDYEQRWPLEGNPKFVRKVSARSVWDTIIESATMCAEPGVIMWDHMIDNLPAHSYPQFKTISTNPCCFDKSSDVWVLTKAGIKEIKQITSDDLVWVDESRAWRKTTGYFDAGNAEVFKVTLSNNESLYVTKNHKLERMTRGLDSDRKVKYQRQLAEVRDLSEGDFIALHEHVVAAADYGSSVGTYEDGVLLGWLTGDGCLSYKKAGDIWPAIHLSCWGGEYDVAEKLLKVAQQYIPGIRLQEYDDGYDNLIKRVVSVGLTRLLTEKYETNLWNFKNGFNPFLYQASLQFLQGYLSAYFSADGTVANTPQNSRYAIQLASVDIDRLGQIRNILCLFGIRSHIGLMKKAARTKIRGRYYESADCYRLTISGYENLKKFNDFVGFLSDAKQEKLLEALDNFKREGRTSAAYAKVVSIESVGIRETGCIKVKGEPKFTANGIISGNSEIALSAYDSCRLISINLTAYVCNAFVDTAHFDFDAFKADVRVAMQMADNLIDLELELIERIKDVIGREEEDVVDRCRKAGCSPELSAVIEKKFNDFSEVEIWNKLKKAAIEGRRTGVGTHGLGDTLAQLCVRYDSELSLSMVDDIYRILRDTAYETSIELAKVRGAFPAFDWETEKNNAYIVRLPDHIKEKLAEHGRRNISMLTQAPTGSVSIISKCGEFDSYNISSGVEPAFDKTYTRYKKINDGDENVQVDRIDDEGVKWHKFKIPHGNVLNYFAKCHAQEDAGLPEYFVFAGEIDGTRRIQIQGVEQQYIDHSISSCLAADNHLVHTDCGLVYIEDLVSERRRGEFCPSAVSTSTINHLNRTAKISEGYYNGTADCYRVLLPGERDVVATGNHKVMVLTAHYDQEWKRVDSIEPGDVLVMRSGLECFGNSQTHISTVLGPFVPTCSMKGSTKKTTLPKRMTKKLARLLGYLTSDGGTNENGVFLSQVRNNVVDDFGALINDVFGFRANIQRDERAESDLLAISVNSRLLRDYFRYLGIKTGAHNKTVPRVIFRCAGRGQTAEFIRGLTLDGFVSEDKVGVLTTTSYRLAREVQTLLDQFNIWAGICKSCEAGERVFPNSPALYATKKSWTLYCGKSEARKFCDLIGFAEDRKVEEVSGKLCRTSRYVSDCCIPNHGLRERFRAEIMPGLSSNRLYDLFNPICGSYRSDMDITRDSLKAMCDVGLQVPDVLLDETYRFVRVKDVYRAGAKDTFDLHIRDGNSYVVNSFVSHNTINLPEETKPEVVADLYMKAWKHKLKGVTVYREGSREGVLVKEDSKKRVKELEEKIARLESQLRGGVALSHAPKRPDALESCTHKIKVDCGGEDGIRNTYVTVSFFPGTRRPYEVFIQVPYSGLEERDLQILELTARSTSMSLRHGLPIEHICEQLEKIGGQYILSVPTTFSRVLRNYIETPDTGDTDPVPTAKSTTVLEHPVSNGLMKCPKCKARTYRPLGQTCGACDSCGYSGCG
jgi:ribonucleotide reductase alpha subunit